MCDGEGERPMAVWTTEGLDRPTRTRRAPQIRFEKPRYHRGGRDISLSLQAGVIVVALW